MQLLSAEECQTCKETLKTLLGKVYQPIVIKELLILQGGAKQVIMTAWFLFDKYKFVLLDGDLFALNHPKV